jgi:hypothetical protein
MLHYTGFGRMRKAWKPTTQTGILDERQAAIEINMQWRGLKLRGGLSSFANRCDNPASE